MGFAELPTMLALIPLLVLAPSHITTGVWYEGGEGAFRNGLIPDDPKEASKMYLSNFQDIAAHGVRIVVAPNSPAPHHKVLLDAASAAGVKVILELGHEADVLGAQVRGKDPVDGAAIDRFLDERLSPIKDHPALERVQICDEPWPGVFDRYAGVARIVNKFSPRTPAFGCVIESDKADAFLTVTKSDVVAFDCYPLGPKTPIGDSNALGHWQAVCAGAAQAALRHRAEAWAVIQCHAITGSLRFPTVGEMRWMTNVALASGCRGVFWFLYQTEWLNAEHSQTMDGLVDPMFHSRPLWDEVGSLTKMIARIEPTLVKLWPANPGVDISSNDAGIFELRDDAGGRFVYIVNPDVVREKTITVRSEKKLAPVGAEKGFRMGMFSGGSVSFNLRAGDGQLFEVTP